MEKKKNEITIRDNFYLSVLKLRNLFIKNNSDIIR